MTWGSTSLLVSSQKISKALEIDGVAKENRMWSRLRSVKDLTTGQTHHCWHMWHTVFSCVLQPLLPVTDSYSSKILLWCRQPHVSSVVLLWEGKHFTWQIWGDTKDKIYHCHQRDEAKMWSQPYNIIQNIYIHTVTLRSFYCICWIKKLQEIRNRCTAPRAAHIQSFLSGSCFLQLLFEASHFSC